VVQVRVSERNCLKVQTATFDCLNNAQRIVARIDADCLLRNFASNHAGVLLKSRDCDLFDNHWSKALYFCS